MERFPSDDWFDKMMVTASNWARPLTEEWFRLMGWLLIIAALGFGVHKTQDIALIALLVISMVVLWLRLMIGYLSVWHDHHTEIAAQFRDPPGEVRRLIVWGIGALVICAIAGLLLDLAWRFSGELAQAIKG